MRRVTLLPRVCDDDSSFLWGSLRSLAPIVFPFSLAMALAGCGSSELWFATPGSGSSCLGSAPGPEVLYGFASTLILNMSVM